jgi:hypothetical protein
MYIFFEIMNVERRCARIAYTRFYKKKLELKLFNI